MAPRRVIEDSDEENGDFASPGLLSPSGIANEVVVNSMMQSSSTDPMLFQAVYEEHLGQLLIDEQPPNHQPLPTFEHPIFDQRMSSSLSIPSGRKLKRSKTINLSSLSSITEPTLSDRKAVRTESRKAADNLTQVTTPRRSKEITQNDLWEVPSSNASDRSIDMSMKVKSTNTERNTSLKTYGRQIRRSQTVTHSTRNTSDDRILSSPMEDDNSQVSIRINQVQNPEGDSSIESRPKRHKRVRLNNDEMFVALAPDLPNPSRSTTGSTPRALINMGVGHEFYTVPWSLSENVEIEMERLASVSHRDLSSPSFTNRPIPDAFFKDLSPANKYPKTQASPPATRSVVVVPDTLSEEQKLQYDAVSVPSTIQSSRSSQLELVAKVDSDEGSVEDPSTVAGLVPSCALSSGMIEDLSTTSIPSSNLPVSAANRKMKRANSEMASRGTIQPNHKILKRKRRSNTTGLNDQLRHREMSIDELCVDSVVSVQKIASKGGAARNKKRTAQCDGEEDRMGNDELHKNEEARLETEQCQPRPSSHRSRSISTQVPNGSTDHGTSRTRLSQRKSLKALVTSSHSALADEFCFETNSLAGLIQPDSATVAPTISKDCFTPTVGSVSDTVAEIPSSAVKQADASVVEAVPPGLVQAKKRGRKRTSEVVAAKAICTLNSQEPDSAPASSNDDETQRKVLCETDNNKQLSQERPNTPLAKNTIADPINDILTPAQTPTKDAKKGPDQHSPLQSGKVPYRVGLSKRTRIAPLLKMIRK